MRRHRLHRFQKQITQIILLLAICYLPLAISYAAVPHLINYQGRLTDSGGTPLDGSYSLTFRIYDAETAGNLLWEENQSGVVIQKGIFSILLGSVKNLDLAFDKPYFLEIKVGEEVMSPRQQITSAGYAIRAENSQNTDSLPRGIIAMWSGTISTIPTGWALCDGTNGTPDLRDRFIVGAKQDDNGVAKTNVTGVLTKSGDGQIPAHTHTYNQAYNNGARHMGNDSTTFYHAQQSVNTGSTGTGTKNIAVYYALAFIMKL